MGSPVGPKLRRLDHLAVAVRDLDQAIRYFSETLGLDIFHREELDEPPVTLVYLDAGNVYIQLVSPRAPCEIDGWLETHGDGLHHVCFAVDDVMHAVEALSSRRDDVTMGTGRGRAASFVRNGAPFGVLIECTEFHLEDGAARGIGSAEAVD